MNNTAKKTLDWEAATDDDVYRYFEQFEREDWIEIGEEGSRQLGELYGCVVEKHSSADNLMSAIAACGWHAAVLQIAESLGVTSFDLEQHLEGYQTGQSQKAMVQGLWNP